jgi:hypothetical protein
LGLVVMAVVEHICIMQVFFVDRCASGT